MEKAVPIKDNIKIILNEVSTALSCLDEKQVTMLINDILHADKIVTCGAGRVGLTTRGFSMRLAHLGFNAYFIQDSNVPSIGPNDLLIVASGSGETQTIFDITEIAHKSGVKISLITGNPKSRMGRTADTIVEIKVPVKTGKVRGIHSIQPMTTLNEQCLEVFFDGLVLSLMEIRGETNKTMWERHSKLE